jgi:hypothetical protein
MDALIEQTFNANAVQVSSKTGHHPCIQQSASAAREDNRNLAVRVRSKNSVPRRIKLYSIRHCKLTDKKAVLTELPCTRGEKDTRPGADITCATVRLTSGETFVHHVDSRPIKQPPCPNKTTQQGSGHDSNSAASLTLC